MKFLHQKKKKKGGTKIEKNKFPVGKNIVTRPLHQEQTFFKGGLSTQLIEETNNQEGCL